MLKSLNILQKIKRWFIERNLIRISADDWETLYSLEEREEYINQLEADMKREEEDD